MVVVMDITSKLRIYIDYNKILPRYARGKEGLLKP
jgi:hypothetical protein